MIFPKKTLFLLAHIFWYVESRRNIIPQHRSLVALNSSVKTRVFPNKEPGEDKSGKAYEREWKRREMSVWDISEIASIHNDGFGEMNERVFLPHERTFSQSRQSSSLAPLLVWRFKFSSLFAKSPRASLANIIFFKSNLRSATNTFALGKLIFPKTAAADFALSLCYMAIAAFLEWIANVCLL